MNFKECRLRLCSTISLNKMSRGLCPLRPLGSKFCRQKIFGSPLCFQDIANNYKKNPDIHKTKIYQIYLFSQICKALGNPFVLTPANLRATSVQDYCWGCPMSMYEMVDVKRTDLNGPAKLGIKHTRRWG